MLQTPLTEGTSGNCPSTSSFHRGSFWAILGQSGSGKSTLLNLLGCLDRPTAGSYLLRGRDTAQLDDDALSELRLRTLGFIFQSFNLIPQLTVEQNIHLPLYYQGWDPAASALRARELAEMVGLEERVSHRPTELSGGQQQRVAVARALVAEPAIVFADEPTGNLDSRSGTEILAFLRTAVDERDQTTVMVTHDPGAASWADRVVFIVDGRVHGEIADPDADEILDVMKSLGR